MIRSLGRRLEVVFSRPDPSEPATALDVPPAAVSRPEVEFVAYGEDYLLSGRTHLAEERLTDMLNEHDEYLLVDVIVERLAEGTAIEVAEVLLQRDELLFVHATGPRGPQARRTRMRLHPLALQMGPYHLRGYLHALPGTDPLLAIRRRKTMVPLTDVWIEFTTQGVPQRRNVGAVVINREQIDWVVSSTGDRVKMPKLPVATFDGPMVKDFTGAIRFERALD